MSDCRIGQRPRSVVWPPVVHPIDMSAAPREFFTVDLRGLRAALRALAAEDGVTESDALRGALAAALNKHRRDALNLPVTAEAPTSKRQIKLSVRIASQAAQRLDQQARAAGLTRGAYLTGLIDGAPAVATSTDRRTGFAALSASAEELALLSRDIHHLTQLLRTAQSRPAQEYRERLQTLDADVQQHLGLAAAVLTELAPARARVRRVHLGPRTPSGRRP